MIPEGMVLVELMYLGYFLDSNILQGTQSIL